MFSENVSLTPAAIKKLREIDNSFMDFIEKLAEAEARKRQPEAEKLIIDVVDLAAASVILSTHFEKIQDNYE